MDIIKFKKNLVLFNQSQSTGIALTDEAISVIGNKPIKQLDLSEPIIIGGGEITAEGGKNFQFKGSKEVVIGGSAGTDLRLGIFGSAAEVLKDLKDSDDLVVSAETLSEGSFYILFSTGYELVGNVEGKWILSHGAISAAVSGSKSKRIVVVKAISPGQKVRDAIVDTIGQFRLPKLIKSPDDLDPGTSLIVESSGSINAEIGAQLGYDFNWLYESNLKGLEGTVGLHLKLGASLAMGFEDAGTYALTLRRRIESDYVDLQLVKQRKRRTSFAMSLAATAKGDLGELENVNLDDLAKATLGVHHAQVMKYLKTAEEWTSPEELKKKIEDLSDGLVRRLTSLVEEPIEEARMKLLGILQRWDKIGEEAGATLWQLLDQKANTATGINLTELRNDFKKIAGPDSNQEQALDFFNEKLELLGFEETDFGKLLNAIIPTDDLLESITDTELFKELRKGAGSILSVLEFEDDIKNFHEKLNEELKLDRIQTALESHSVADLGELMTDKLSDLVIKNGEVVFEELQKIQDFVDNIRSKSVEILEKTKIALQREYGVSFAAKIQKQREEEALIHASFLIGKAKARELFKQALDGNFDRLLTEKVSKDVLLRKGVLTHRVNKSTSVSLSLPYMKRDFTHINNSLASGTFIDEQDGRLMMYDMEAEDTIRRSRQMSQLALEGHYKVLAGKDGSEHPEKALKMAYSFRLAKKRLRTRHLEQIIEPFFKLYLPKAFDDVESETKISTEQWIRQMDDEIEAVNSNGKFNFGTTLLNLELRIPASIGAAWFDAPSKVVEYKDVSNKIQERLRQIIPLYFLENESVFTDDDKKGKLYGIMVYESLPTKTDFTPKNRFPKRHWKWHMKDQVKKLVTDRRTKVKLQHVIARIQQRLKEDHDSDLTRKAKDFDPLDASLMSTILSRAITDRDDVYDQLLQLFQMEQKIVIKTIEAGLKLAKFVESSNGNPSQAIQSLQEFGSEITKAFNKHAGFGSIAAKKDYTRYLSTELFVAVAEALEPGLKADIGGMFELMVLKNDPKFDFKTYLDGAMPEPEDLIISSRIMDID